MNTWNSNGKEIKVLSNNEVLTSEQKRILSIADMNSDIAVNIDYKRKNSITGDIEISKMNYVSTLVPNVEAEYVGGKERMNQYLKENLVSKISTIDNLKMIFAAVRFTIDEDGEVINAKISQTSKDEKTDKLLLQAINNMPKWKPAEDSNGKRVKQEFEFSIGNGGGGC